MSDLKIGQRYKVLASSGLNLRKEPATSADVILVMQQDTYVTLESDEARESDGYRWYNVRYGDEVGWAASEYLELVPLIEPEGPPIAKDYLFTFNSALYDMPAGNLGKCSGKYIFTGTVGQYGQTILTVDNTSYWTTAKNMDDMLKANLISLR